MSRFGWSHSSWDRSGPHGQGAREISALGRATPATYGRQQHPLVRIENITWLSHSPKPKADHGMRRFAHRAVDYSARQPSSPVRSWSLAAQPPHRAPTRLPLNSHQPRATARASVRSRRHRLSAVPIIGSWPSRALMARSSLWNSLYEQNQLALWHLASNTVLRVSTQPAAHKFGLHSGVVYSAAEHGESNPPQIRS